MRVYCVPPLNFIKLLKFGTMKAEEIEVQKVKQKSRCWDMKYLPLNPEL